MPLMETGSEDKRLESFDEVILSEKEHPHIHIHPGQPPYQECYEPRGVSLGPPHVSFPAIPGHLGSLQYPYEQVPSQVTIDFHPTLSESTDHGATKKSRRLDEPAGIFGSDTGGDDSQGPVCETSWSEEHGASGSDHNPPAYKVHRSSRSGNKVKTRMRGSLKPEAIAAYLAADAVSPLQVPVQAQKIQRSSSSGTLANSNKAKHRTRRYLKPETIAALEAAGAGFPYQDERGMKREIRKLQNREAAMRSRMKKLAEIDQLVKRHESLNTENMSLKSELSRLMEDSEKLRIENAALLEKLKDAKPRTQAGMVAVKTEVDLDVQNKSTHSQCKSNLVSVKMEQEHETHDSSNPDFTSGKVKLEFSGQEAPPSTFGTKYWTGVVAGATS